MPRICALSAKDFGHGNSRCRGASGKKLARDAENPEGYPRSPDPEDQGMSATGDANRDAGRKRSACGNLVALLSDRWTAPIPVPNYR
jgi:hypothetical protein